MVGGFNVHLAETQREALPTSRGRPSSFDGLRTRFPYLADKNVTFAVDVVLEAGRNQISIGVMDLRSKATGFEVYRVP